MQLTKIEINGFKSFAKKQELAFPSGITAIIGPNGCGKSNIADAFRFVLGEQSARALRGKRVEDFIFGGTQKRKALSFCEVSLYFDNSDGALLTPYSDVCITRRAFRSGESEYYINRTPCRLKDIHELFRDTGIGKDGYSIIGQGKVADVLSDKGTDRRVAFEEAAGVMKFRSRKEEAERKLQNTQKNIVRLDDILAELDSRIGPLREQSEKALEYFRLREELRDIDLNLFINQYERTTERVSQLTDNISQLTDSISAAEYADSTIASSLAQDEEIERSLSSSVSEASQRLLLASTAAESSVGEEKVLSERIASLGRECQRLETVAKDEQSLNDSCLSKIRHIRDILQSHTADIKNVDMDVSCIESRLSTQGKLIEEKEDELERHKQSMMDAMNRLSDAKSRISRLDEMKRALLSRIEAIDTELAEVLAEGAKLAQEQRECDDAFADIASESCEIVEKRNAAIIAVNDVNEHIYAARQRERSLENELESAKSRRKVLAEMKRAHEGYYSSVKDLLRDANRDAELGALIEGVVAELISVPQEFEAAIEMSLGAALQNIVVPTEQSAKIVIEYLRKKNYGRATMLPISAMRPRSLTPEERSCVRVDGCFGVASDLIRFSPQYRNVVESLLGRTVIVRDIDTGIAINRRAHSAFRIATLKGDILNPGGSMTGGSIQKREFSLLGRERELEVLSGKISGISGALEAMSAEFSAFNEQLVSANARVAELSDELKALEVRRAAIAEKADIIRKYVDKNHACVERLGIERSQIGDNIADIEAQLSQANADETGLNTGSASSGEDVRRVQADLHTLREEQQRLTSEYTALKVRQMAAHKEYATTEAELSRIGKESDAHEANARSSIARSKELQSEVSALKVKHAALVSAIGDDRKSIDSITNEVRRLEAEREERLKSIDELRKRRDDCRIELEGMRERKHKAELTLNRVQLELDSTSQRIWQEYELTYENALAYRRQISVNASHLRADQLRADIRALGEVNTASVEDYRNVSERHAELTRQLEDLKQAEVDLDDIIKRLTTTMEHEFAEQFKQIRANFAKTFTELFHGGTADLRLSDPDDILNCDIDIIAQPPGKKLQLLSLLSGGEQALTAIALLFAILRLKPTAFCILDEIDTSLDEANVDNFAEYLRSYSKDTQFIVITHRKGCMAVCDSLYGVSMEEKGVSMLVSARFGDNESISA